MNTITPILQHSTATVPAVRLFASAQSWIEDEAVRQLYAIARLGGIRSVVGFPDLYPGRGMPVGVAIVTDDIIYPHLISRDTGCGMSLFKTDLVQADIKLDRWAELRFDLEHPWHGDVSEVLVSEDLQSTEFDGALGTFGAGNHFAELQCVEKVFDTAVFKRLSI